MILDRLPRHITGFFDRSEQLRAIEPEGFKAACYLVAGMEGGSVESLHLDRVARSYYAATVRTRSDHLSVLCNATHPYLAFVAAGTFGGWDSEFIAPVSLASAFASVTEFQPLDADWLAADLRAELLADLASGELEQVKYWKPQRIGDVVFNCWD
ncbi:MAG: hypothetical protein AB7O91_11565 [Sphingomonas sp.]